LQNHDLNNGYAMFRKCFTLATVPKTARLSIAAALYPAHLVEVA